MKKIFFILFVLLFVVSAAFNVVTLTSVEEGGELLIMDQPLSYWIEYAKTELFPAVVLALSSLGTVYAMLTPMINKFKLAMTGFSNATQYIDATTGASLKSVLQVSKLEADLKKESEELNKKVNEKIEKFETDILSMQNLVQQNTEILKIGLCSMPSLVRNGTASRIASLSGEGEVKVYEKPET